jgi:hypothetical protein
MTIHTDFEIGDEVWYIDAFTLKATKGKIKGLAATQTSFPHQLTWQLDKTSTEKFISAYITVGNSVRKENQLFHTKEELLKSL